MPSQLHLILSTAGELSAILRDMKSHTSRTFRESISANTKESKRELLLWIAYPVDLTTLEFVTLTLVTIFFDVKMSLFHGGSHLLKKLMLY